MAASCTAHFPLQQSKLLALPAEIRVSILEYVFKANSDDFGLQRAEFTGVVALDNEYFASARLHVLLACRQMYSDGSLMAMSRTAFIVSNLFFDMTRRLAVLHHKQIEAIQTVAFVADARHFRKILFWGQYPFGMPTLRLQTLTIVLHRSSFWHYLFDFTSDVVQLLRKLEGVQSLVFVRNNALVKGSFGTWYNRLVGLIMKFDHHQRYEVSPPCLEKVWWSWSYDRVQQTFCFEAGPPKPLVDKETYMRQMMPLMEELRASVENEEWNPDPRCRNGA